MVLRERGRLHLYHRGLETRVSYRSAARACELSDWIIIQYSPFGLGRWGFAPWLLPLAGMLRRRARIGLVVHEPYVRGMRGHRRLMGAWQRLQLTALGRTAGISFIPTKAWIGLLQREARLERAVHLPVSSNLPDARSERLRMRSELGVGADDLVLATFGLGHISTLRGHIEAAVDAVSRHRSNVIFVQLGLGPPIHGSAETVTIRPGWLPAHEVAAHLAAADIFLAPFADGVSDRRTTVAAAAQHGIAVVTTTSASSGPSSDWADTGFLLVPADDQRAFADAAVGLARNRQQRDQCGLRARAYFVARRDWPVIARRMLDELSDADEAAARCAEEEITFSVSAGVAGLGRPTRGRSARMRRPSREG
jgi:hypothetical protein